MSCKTQNEKEKFLIGNWSVEPMGTNYSWEFTEKGIINAYYSNNLNNSYYYSIINTCPAEYKKYQSKWEIDYYLYLIDVKDSLNIRCFEIIFERNGEVSIRDLALERDTYEILKRI